MGRWQSNQALNRVVGGLLLLLTPFVWAEEANHPHEEILQAVEHFIRAEAERAGGTDLEVKVQPIDSRLKLPFCESPLDLTTPTSSRRFGRLSVAVKCAGAKPWTLYVQGEAVAFAEVVVATRPLARGEIITADAVKLQRMGLGQGGGDGVRSLDAVIGKEVSRAISAEMPLLLSMVKLPMLVTRGELVTIIAQTDLITIRMSGKALSSGALGEVVRVQNSSSKKEIEGVVIGAATVQVNRE